MTKPLTFETATDQYNFHVGKPVHLVWDESVPGLLRRPTRWERLRSALASVLPSRGSRAVVTAVDVDAGTVTVGDR